MWQFRADKLGAAVSPTASYGSIALTRCPKHDACLFHPGQCRALGELHSRNGNDFPSKHQPFQHLGRQIGQTQLAADVEFRQFNVNAKLLSGVQPFSFSIIKLMSRFARVDLGPVS